MRKGEICFKKIFPQSNWNVYNETAMVAGNYSAICNLAHMYREGVNVPQILTRQFPFLMRSSKKKWMEYVTIIDYRECP